MVSLTHKGLQEKEKWRHAQVKLPSYSVETVAQETRNNPTWIHFGSGNIFRGYIAALADTLLDNGDLSKGIIAAETYDNEIIEKIYTPFDNLALLVTLHANGNETRRVIGSIAEGVFVSDFARLLEIFTNRDLQIVSFTITEKGYATPATMETITKLLYARYQAGASPIAMVSMDNCSKNGDILKNAVLSAAKKMDDTKFIEYINNEHLVSFPWSMIDKITPRPTQEIATSLAEAGIADMAPIQTSKGTFIAPFVNAEAPQYLVIEDNFPNGRPALEKAGVYMTDREHVNKVERMKVTTCLNPLHTGLSIFGCLLGYDKVSEVMKDPDLRNLVLRIGYTEGLPVVEDPEILDPKKFIDEVVEERLPNPFLLDAPQRIVTDTSQKIAIRFGETIKAYDANGNANSLVAIPLVLAGWLRYLQGIDDNGNPMPLSNDPRLEEVKSRVSVNIDDVLTDESLFGVDLEKVGLAEKVKVYYAEMNQGNGSVRKTIKEALQ